MARKFHKFLSIISFSIAILMMVNSKLDITGNIVRIERFDKTFSSIISIAFLLIGALLLMAANNDKNNKIASKLYETLGRRDAFRHHTERIERIEKYIAKGNISRKEVNKIIKMEISKGHLNKRDGENSISIPMKKDIIYEIVNGYDLSQKVKDRLEELIKGEYPSGSKSGKR